MPKDSFNVFNLYLIYFKNLLLLYGGWFVDKTEKSLGGA
jgi:hypothetical protein